MNEHERRVFQSAEFRAKARRWLKDHPPPRGWKGSDLEWAFLEMPSKPWWVSAVLDWLRGRR